MPPGIKNSQPVRASQCVPQADIQQCLLACNQTDSQLIKRTSDPPVTLQEPAPNVVMNYRQIPQKFHKNNSRGETLSLQHQFYWLNIRKQYQHQNASFHYTLIFAIKKLLRTGKVPSLSPWIILLWIFPFRTLTYKVLFGDVIKFSSFWSTCVKSPLTYQYQP